MKRCKFCHVSVNNVDSKGRCPSCADAGNATRAGLHYGDYIAHKERGTLPPTPRRDRLAAVLLDYVEPVELPKCRICGGNVFPPRRFLCSPKCEAEDKRRKARHRTDENPRLCPICGKPVRIDRRRIYCDDDCAYKAARERERIYRTNKQKGDWK